MAVPSTSVLDNFNRADEATLSGGGNWAASPSTGNALKLVSNAVNGKTGSIANESYWTPGSSFGPDCEAYCTVVTIGGGYLRLHVRVTNPASATVRTGYMMQWSNDSNGCRIFRETSTGSFTQLAQSSGARYVSGDVVVLNATSSTIAVYNNGTLVLSVTNTVITAAGYIILGCGSNNWVIDDFGGGTATGAPATSIKTVMGVTYPTNVKTAMGLAQASVKTIDGLA